MKGAGSDCANQDGAAGSLCARRHGFVRQVRLQVWGGDLTPGGRLGGGHHRGDGGCRAVLWILHAGLWLLGDSRRLQLHRCGTVGPAEPAGRQDISPAWFRACDCGPQPHDGGKRGTVLPSEEEEETGETRGERRRRRDSGGEQEGCQKGHCVNIGETDLVCNPICSLNREKRVPAFFLMIFFFLEK